MMHRLRHLLRRSHRPGRAALGLALALVFGAPALATPSAPAADETQTAKAPAVQASATDGTQTTRSSTRGAFGFGRHDDKGPASSLGAVLLDMVLILGGICLLAYLLLGKLLPKMLRITPLRANQRLFRVIDRMPIDTKRALLVVQVSDLYCVLGVTEHNITLLSRLEPEQIPEASETTPETSDASLFRRLLQQKRGGS